MEADQNMYIFSAIICTKPLIHPVEALGTFI